MKPQQQFASHSISRPSLKRNACGLPVFSRIILLQMYAIHKKMIDDCFDALKSINTMERWRAFQRETVASVSMEWNCKLPHFILDRNMESSRRAG